MKRLLLRRPLPFVVALALVAALPLRAYVLGDYRWPSGAPISFYLNPANRDVSEAAAEIALQAGMESWNRLDSSFRFQYAGRVSDTTTGADRRNVVLFRNAANPDNESAIATTYSWSQNGVRIDSDIVFWDGRYRFFTGLSGCVSGAYIEDVATHELGHALGLGHSQVSGATMYPSYPTCSTTLRTPAEDDVAGVQSLYPAQGTTVPAAPEGLVAVLSVGAPSSSAQLSWTDRASNETGFVVQRASADGVFVELARLGPNVHDYVNTSMSASAHYRFRVAAFNGVGTSAFSEPVSIVTAASTNAPPLVLVSPNALPSRVTGTTTALSVLGADDGGEENLVYTWSASGPAAVHFSANGSHDAKASTATFTRAGNYVIEVSVRDIAGAVARSAVAVAVTAVLDRLALAPEVSALPAGTAQQLFATAIDQFGAAIVPAPPITWSVDGAGGSVSPTGLFTSGTEGEVAVVARAQGKSASAAITVVTGGEAPALAFGASAWPPIITGDTTRLSVLGDDDGGVDALVYTWSAIGPGAVSFEENGTNAARQTNVRFTRAGEYLFHVRIVDAEGFTTVDSVAVIVEARLGRLLLTPGLAKVPHDDQLRLETSGADQFGDPIAVPDAVRWNTNGAGLIEPDGGAVKLVATGAPGAYLVTAEAGGAWAVASVEVLSSDASAGPNGLTDPTQPRTLTGGCSATGGAPGAALLAVLAFLLFGSRGVMMPRP